MLDIAEKRIVPTAIHFNKNLNLEKNMGIVKK